MPERARQAYREWKLADQDASAVEHEVQECWARHQRKQGPPPSAELLEKASRLRANANAKLRLAMELMRPGAT